MDTVVDRLIRYAKVYSESDYHAGRSATPSTDRQFDMAKLLVEELRGLGIENARYDDKCYVYATLEPTPGCEHLPAIGLIAHMDTTPDMTGKDVKPQIIHYTGGDVVLNREQNIVMKAEQFPELAKFVGQDLVCSDGTTLLGADDKAGIAIILQAVEELLAEKARAAGICHQACTAPRRARRTVPANPQAPSHADPRTARRRAGAEARLKAFFSFGPCTARFLFGKTEKKMGGALPSYQHS